MGKGLFKGCKPWGNSAFAELHDLHQDKKEKRQRKNQYRLFIAPD